MLTALRKQGYKLNIAMQCESPEAIKTAVTKKLGVGILYEDAVKEGLASGVFKKLRISGLQMEGTSYIVYHKQTPALVQRRHLSQPTEAVARREKNEKM